ncbi:putative LOG family protein [Lupinus albus]|uniref:cytokinin riboside 5'-monophosphate phosphoribohydrolase n=1 Tax=Lupinus albus TaxID=3870 RepID=A0A6A4NA32_LUPAL|nr:putative LOG family protein [Lupinus albus]
MDYNPKDNLSTFHEELVTGSSLLSTIQLGILDKQVGLLNVDGYYNSLLSFIEKAVEEGPKYSSSD